MKHILRIIIAFLILAMTLPMAISCVDTGKDAVTTEPAKTEAPSGDSGIEATTAEDTLFAPSDIPDDLRFDGTTINILYWDDVPNTEFFVEDQTGEAVNDAIFKRNSKVQEQFGVTLEFIGTPGNNENQNQFVNTCVNSTQSGADAYDLFCGYSMTGASIMTQGISQDLTDYDIIEFDKPWWPKSLISKATINGGIYFASGDISTNYLYMMYLCLFNKDMLTNVHNISSDVLYELVYNNEWTVDKLIEYTTGVYRDDNGDSQSNEGDRFGLVVTSVHVDPFYTGSDLNILEVNEDGELYLSKDLFSEKTVTLLEKLATLLHTSGECNTSKGYQIFAANQSLFISERAFITSRNLADASFSYGILPTPKYDKDQEGYRTCLSFGYTLYNLSTAAPDAEAAAATLELLAYQSYLNVTPALFEESMKLRYADQSDDAFMFDYVRDGVIIDIGRLFTTQLDKMSYSIFRNALVKNTVSSYTSAQKAHEKTLNIRIASINESLKNLK